MPDDWLSLSEAANKLYGELIGYSPRHLVTAICNKGIPLRGMIESIRQKLDWEELQNYEIDETSIRFNKFCPKYRAPIFGKPQTLSPEIYNVEVGFIALKEYLVEFSGLKTIAETKAKPTAKAEAACRTWILSLSEEPIRRKYDVWIEAKEQFGENLSKRGFNRVWENSAHQSWKTAGSKAHLHST